MAASEVVEGRNSAPREDDLTAATNGKKAIRTAVSLSRAVAGGGPTARPELVREHAFKNAAQTPGIVRRKAFASEGVWAGVATTEPGIVSGWHHHGDHSTYLYITSGRFRLESGPLGRDLIEAGPGDFVKIPARTIHRESNPASERAHTIVIRVGTGPVVVNVAGPDSGRSRRKR